MTQQIQPKSTLSIPFTTQSSISATTTSNQSSSSSHRSGMRRLRTETSSTPRFITTSASTSTSSTRQRFYDEFQEKLIQLKKAFEKGNYEKALRMLDDMEPLIKKAAKEFICEECISDSSKISSKKLEKVRDLLSDAFMAGS